MNETTPIDLDAMTPEAARVAIAKDVLKHLAAQRLRPVTGTYLHIPEEVAGSVDLQPVLARAAQCTVCALGACFAAAVMSANQFSTSAEIRFASREPVAGLEMRDHLARWFDRVQLGIIEAAFERDGEFAYGEYATEADADAAEDFGEQYDDSAARMAAIMQNIIDNNGTFKP